MARFIAVTTADKQAALDDAWDAAADNDNTLRPQLRKLEQAARADVPNAVKASSSNGHSGMAFDPGQDAPSTTESARIWRELIQLFDECYVWLTNPTDYSGCVQASWQYRKRDFSIVALTLPVAAPTDEQVDARMRELLVPMTEARGDYSQLRTVNGGAFQ